MTRVLLLLIFFSSHSGAVNIQYESKRNEILAKEEQNRNILSQLYEMQMSLKKINNEKSRLLSKKNKLEQTIQKLDPILHSAEKRILSQKIEIQKRLLYILKFQDMSLLKVVFSSQTPSELDRNLRILKNLTDRDYLSLKTYFRDAKTLRTKQEELLNKKSALLSLEKDISLKEIQLTGESQRKNKILGDIDKQKSKLLVNLKTIRERASKTKDAQDFKKQEFLETILEPMFFERKGQIPAPIKGKIVQKYGNFEHPVFKTHIRHKGLFFAADSLADVRAISKGKVVHIEKDPVSGYSLVIDHGDHYYSVYSYLNDMIYKIDDAVGEGDVLAKSVVEHPFFGEGVYFELRHFSEPVDPASWLLL